MILPAVLYGYETLPLMLSENHRLGLKKEEVVRRWRKMQTEINNFSSSANITAIKSRRIR
jgi:hypothetical protein